MQANRSLVLIAALFMGVTGCAHVSPMTAGDIPPAFEQPVPANASPWPETAFWRAFDNSELVRLVDTAKTKNLDIAAAAARVAQAEARLRIAGAALFPAVDIGADATTRGAKGTARTTSDLGVTASGGDWSERTGYGVSAAASYEIDFWGKNRALRRAAKQALVASRFDEETVALTATASVANTYFLVLSLRERVAIAQSNLENAERVLSVVESRVRNGAASPLDLAQQRATVAGQRAAVPAVEQQEREARAALAILLGRAPEGFKLETQSLAALTAPVVTPGLPSDLLIRRPDIRSAEARLEAADANVAAARAAFFPSINLTGSAGLESAALSTLFSGVGALYSAAASLSQPLFRGGQIAGSFALSKAERDELVQQYRLAVFQSFADVENALGQIASEGTQAGFRETQAREAATAFRIAETRYREGATDLLELLEAQRTLYAAQDSLAQARLGALQAPVTLFRALGGGWPDNRVAQGNVNSTGTSN